MEERAGSEKSRRAERILESSPPAAGVLSAPPSSVTAIKTTTATTIACPARAAIFFTGPTYSTADMRLSRKLYVKNGWRLEFTAESFNLFNRLNARYRITDDGLMDNQASFNYGTNKLGINYFPAYYQVPTNFAYAPRQIQFALRLGF